MSGHSLVPLRDLILESQNGLSKRSGADGVETPVLRLANITVGSIDESDPREIRLTAKELAKYALRHGDLVCIRVNGSKALVGRVIQFRANRVWAYCDHFIRLRPNHALVDHRYLAHYFNSQTVRRHIELNMVSSAGQNTVSQGTMLDIPVPCPGLDAQREIVAELEKQFSRLDEAVASLRRVKANLKRYKASVLKAAVEGRLVETEATLARREGRTYETGEQLLQAAIIARRTKWDRRGQYVEPAATTSDDLLPVPDGWIWATVEQLGFVRGGKRLPAGHKYAGEVTPHPYIRVTDFAEYSVNLDGLLYLKPETQREIHRYTISSDDLYISIAGSIGLVGVLPERLSGANLTENAAKITGLEHVSKRYLMYWLSSAKGIDFISDSTIATTQAKLALYRIERIPVPLPPLAEQARIVAEVDRHLSIIREVEAEVDTNLQRAQALRQATLATAFGIQSAQPEL